MKKSAKPVLFYSFVAFILLSLFLTGYIAAKLKCDQLLKNIVQKEEVINVQKGKQVFLSARLQKFIAGDRIQEIAVTELGMIKREEPRIALEVSKAKIEMIEKTLAEKYE